MLTANMLDIVADYRQRKNYSATDFWIDLWIFWYPNLPEE